MTKVRSACAPVLIDKLTAFAPEETFTRVGALGKVSVADPRPLRQHRSHAPSPSGSTMVTVRRYPTTRSPTIWRLHGFQNPHDQRIHRASTFRSSTVIEFPPIL